MWIYLMLKNLGPWQLLIKQYNFLIQFTLLWMVGIKAHNWLDTSVGWSLSLFSIFLLLNLNVVSLFFFLQIWRCWTKLKTFISRLAYISVLFAMLATFPSVIFLFIHCMSTTNFDSCVDELSLLFFSSVTVFLYFPFFTWTFIF